MKYFEELLSQIEERWPGSIPERAPEDTGMPRGPTIKIRERAELFRRPKEQHMERIQRCVTHTASRFRSGNGQPEPGRIIPQAK